MIRVPRILLRVLYWIAFDLLEGDFRSMVGTPVPRFLQRIAENPQYPDHVRKAAYDDYQYYSRGENRPGYIPYTCKGVLDEAWECRQADDPNLMDWLANQLQLPFPYFSVLSRQVVERICRALVGGPVPQEPLLGCASCQRIFSSGMVIVYDQARLYCIRCRSPKVINCPTCCEGTVPVEGPLRRVIQRAGTCRTCTALRQQQSEGQPEAEEPPF